MRLSAAVLATTLLATAAGAREVRFPLLVDHALLRASLARQLGEERDGSALVWGTRGSCRSLVLSDLRVRPRAAGRGSAGPHQGLGGAGAGASRAGGPGDPPSARRRRGRRGGEGAGRARPATRGRDSVAARAAARADRGRALAAAARELGRVPRVRREESGRRRRRSTAARRAPGSPARGPLPPARRARR